MHLKQITDYLDTYFDIAGFRDDSMNGLQVENSENVEKIGFSVDACHEAIIKAAENRCSLLIVHHGLFWGTPLLIKDHIFQRIRSLIMADMALYAVHLPLDCHPEVGHNIVIARELMLAGVENFSFYNGKPIGIKATFPAPLPFDQAVEEIKEKIGSCTGVLEFGSDTVSTVAVLAGSATDPELYKELKRQSIDLFITGEPKHGAYYLAQEFGLNVFFGGHYMTETFGLKALGKHLEEVFGMDCCFIDTPCVF